jgi:cyanophycinase
LPLYFLFKTKITLTYPKGHLVAVGGAEDKGTDLEKGILERNRLNFFELGILKSIVSLISGTDPFVEVVTTASTIPDEVAQKYIDGFNKLGITNIGHLRIRNREDAHNPEYIDRLKKCNCIMLSGGNQLRLTSIFGGTEFLDILVHKYHNEDFLVAGTSAGAMAMSNPMIYEGNASLAHLKGEVKITTGLGLIQHAMIDTHFDKRGRFNRLAQAVAAHPGATGVGLGEDTGVIVSEGHVLQAIGSGSVVIIDGRKIEFNNIADIDFGKPISVENIIVHMMSKGDQYNLETRTFEGAEVIISEEV